MTQSADLILVLAASAGAGHMTAARALEQALRTAAPASQVEVVDVLTIGSRFLRRVYAGGYLDLVRYAPSAMGWLYEVLDRPGTFWLERWRQRIQNLFTEPIARYLETRRPRLVLNTHYLPAEIIAQLRRAGRLTCPQVVVTTDFDTHRVWAQQPAERYYTPVEAASVYLTTWGIPPQRVRTVGIPVRAGFDNQLPKAEARHRCGLEPERPVVLLLCGGFGVGPTAELLTELAAMPNNAQLVVIAGRNEPLRQRLERLVGTTPRSVRVLGFTEQVFEWMRAADLAVTKPGGLTVAESLACELPLVLVSPIPGQETRNADYLLEQGAAVKVNNTRMLGWRVAKLLSDTQQLGALQTAAKRLGRPHAARDIVADALSLLDGGGAV
jgi:processive 1,2-diacylglycerol beta-glucosyltransferase